MTDAPKKPLKRFRALGDNRYGLVLNVAELIMLHDALLASIREAGGPATNYQVNITANILAASLVQDILPEVNAITDRMTNIPVQGEGNGPTKKEKDVSLHQRGSDEATRTTKGTRKRRIRRKR